MSEQDFPAVVNRMRRRFNTTGQEHPRPWRPSRGENISPRCPIINRSVDLETAKTDEHGLATHEECYLLKVCLEETTPFTTPQADVKDIALEKHRHIVALRSDCHFADGTGIHVLECFQVAQKAYQP